MTNASGQSTACQKDVIIVSRAVWGSYIKGSHENERYIARTQNRRLGTGFCTEFSPQRNTETKRIGLNEGGFGVARNCAFGAGKPNKNGGSDLRSVLYGNGTGMVLDNLADDGETKASAIGLAKTDEGIK